MKPSTELTFLKLGGSLITDKTRPLTARTDLIRQIAQELAAWRSTHPACPLVIGHGSGSFGHSVASQYQTQDGVRTAEEWQGFAQVWSAARALNQILMEQLSEAGLPVLAFPPSAGAISSGKSIQSWDLAPLKLALAHNLIPVVQGDVIFDTKSGGTIVSTEQVFQHLVKELPPGRILLAGADAGVYADPPNPEDIIPLITPDNFEAISSTLSGSAATDVTGGMLAKVALMLTLVKTDPTLKVQIFSGSDPENIQKALSGERLGTLIST